jgi:hypothetical protein
MEKGMPVLMRRITFMPASSPPKVEVLISDNERADQAAVWIAAKFPFEGPSNANHGALVQQALDQLQSLITEAKEDAARPLTISV